MTQEPGFFELSEVGVAFNVKQGSVTKKLEALRNIALGIKAQELLVVIGESGSGKTTLGRVIAGLQQPTHGKMVYKGSEIRKMSRDKYLQYRLAVQLVHQDPYTSLNPALTIEQSLVAGIRRWTKGMSRPDASQKAGDLLELVGLSEQNHLKKFPHQLSGGQRQRVAIARSISITPEIIVLDEPVSMIDASLRIDILDMLLNIKQQLGTAYVFITHDVALARYFCQKAGGGKIMVLYRGSLMEEGDTEDVILNTANPYTMALIASTPGSRSKSLSWTTKLAHSQEDDLQGCRFYPRCLYAQDLCRTTEPPLKQLGGDHRSACHFAETFTRETR